MNYLELCQAAAREGGTIAGIPSFSTVSGTTGRLADLVAAVANAYRDLQNERMDWLFRRKEYTKALIINQTTYTAASFNLEVSRWFPDNPYERTITLYDNTIGQSDEGELRFIDYPIWRRKYDRGSHDANRPTEWSVTPAGKLAFGSKPDKAYVIRGEYVGKPQILVADGDELDMPEEYHGVIVQKALELMSEMDEAWESLKAKAMRMGELKYPLVRDQTPNMTSMGGVSIA